MSSIEVPGADVSIYVGAALADKENAASVAIKLRQNRCRVVSTWHDEATPPLFRDVIRDATDAEVWPRRGLVTDVCEGIAATRFGQILDSHWALFLSTGAPDELGLMSTELGFAIGIKRQVLIIGEPTSAFHCVHCVKVCKDVQDFLVGLTKARMQAVVKTAKGGIAHQALLNMRNNRLNRGGRRFIP